MWQSAPAAVLLHDDEVHVWRAQLDTDAQHLVAYQSSLSVDEMARAQRLHNPADRRRYIVRRGILRSLLSTYLGITPAEIQFRYTAYGQPWLRIRDQRHVLRFTLAHAFDQALYAVSQSRDIGIDIEYIQSSFDYEPIAGNLFAAEEHALLCALPPSQRATAFFRLWTCKEAYVKACGLGLALPLNTFAIALDPHKPAYLLYSHDQHGGLRSNLRELPIDEQYVAALAVEGSDWQLKCWHYTV